MNLPDPSELSTLIDCASDAVDKSKFGPMLQANSQDITKKVISPVAWTVFQMVLGGLIQKTDFKDQPNAGKQG